jgi:TolA-binding protein
MKKLLVIVLIILTQKVSQAQQTRYYTDPAAKFKDAKEYFQKEEYSLAYPLFRELRRDIRETDKANLPVTVQEINYYTIACGLKQHEERSEEEARQFIDIEKNNARVQMMNFQLGEYYFHDQKFGDAVQRYELANPANLSSAEVSALNYHAGYAYFTMQNFSRCKPLFNVIRKDKHDPNYLDANYYYGFLAFRDKQYDEALECFKIVENGKRYDAVVPYYIAQILYIQGKKDEAINYISGKLAGGSSSQYYDLELKQLIGHAYFEKKEYAKALPYLEGYVNGMPKVRREDLYELSYCYYQAGNYKKSIDGFKQLSGKDDSLSQHAMYLLGDAYLKTDQKSNARNAFLFCSSNSSNAEQKEIASFQFAKLSYELGYQDDAINGLRNFNRDYPQSTYNTEARDLMVQILAGTNNFKDAQALIESLDKPSENTKKVYPRILFGRASELINDGRLEDADVLLNKVIADPYNPPILPLAWFWKGEIAYRKNQLDSAIKYYQLYAGSAMPAVGEANFIHVKYNLGYCYLRKENYPVAQTYFESLVKPPALNSDNFSQDVYIRTADCYFMQKNYTQSKTMYDNVIKFSWPAEDYASFQDAMLAGVKSPTEKITMMNTMIRKFPKSSLVMDANMEIANTYLGEENFREAIPALTDITKSSNNATLLPQAYLKLGTAYYNINNNNEALKNFEYIVDHFSNSPEAGDALDDIKLIYMDDGKAAEYAEYMRKAGKPLNSSTEDSLTFSAAEKLYDDQKLSEAAEAFAAYTDKFPHGVYALEAGFNRAEIFNAQKKWADALPAYQQVIGMAPNKYAERSALTASHISFFELKDYAQAEMFFTQLKQWAATQENKLEAMRGLLRCQYQQQKWTDAAANADDLLKEKNASADDRSLANMAIGKSLEAGNQYDLALVNFRAVAQNNKAALAAEARYEIANCLFQLNKLSDAEKSAMECINKSGSYDFWITKSYILLGDIYFRQKDYFNAKATLQSVVDHTLNTELKEAAQQKLDTVIQEEKNTSKINN